ncbi:MAG: substrate-binding domain-containing protein [Bacteroidota bacterium]|nr:ribose ABC transporter substrate-binding protein [Odoribacter sp.]MDP3644202.1 substrate-binding domain-containing protein [Bacteroidota bacterium]
MKISFFSLFVLFLASVFIFSGCKTKTPKVGILIHSYENERWEKDKNYLLEDLTKLGAEVMLEVADNNQQKQIEQAATMIKNGAKVLIVVPINQDEAAKIVNLAHESGVKVIAYDRLINGCKLDYYVSANSTQIGELQASYLTSLRPKGKYALICGSKHDNNSMRLFLGQMNVLQSFMEKGDIQVVYSEFTDDWSTEQGIFHTNRIFDQSQDSITGIIAGNDKIALGVITVLKERGMAGKTMVAGQDAELENVKSIMLGIQTCTVLKPLREMAGITSELAVSLALEKPLNMKFTTESNGKALVKSILIDAIVVNKNNIESTVVSSGFHSSAQINQ